MNWFEMCYYIIVMQFGSCPVIIIAKRSRICQPWDFACILQDPPDPPDFILNPPDPPKFLLNPPDPPDFLLNPPEFLLNTKDSSFSHKLKKSTRKSVRSLPKNCPKISCPEPSCPKTALDSSSKTSSESSSESGSEFSCPPCQKRCPPCKKGCPPCKKRSSWCKGRYQSLKTGHTTDDKGNSPNQPNYPPPNNTTSNCPPTNSKPQSCPEPTCPPQTCPEPSSTSSHAPQKSCPESTSAPPQRCPDCAPPSCPSSMSNSIPKPQDAMLTLFFKNASLTKSIPSTTSTLTNILAESMATLETRQTIIEVALMENPNSKFPTTEQLLNMFKADNNDTINIIMSDKLNIMLKNKVVDSITRVLKFYAGQMHQTSLPGLIFLKGIDDKHGKIFQNNFPLKDWIHDACHRKQINSIDELDLCHSIAKKWINRSGEKKKIKMTYWKNISIIQNELNEIDKKIVENIGNEPEELWLTLTMQCLIAVGIRCELPLACERTFLDPTPRSQYMLTHQVLMRMLIDIVDCPSLKSFASDENTYTKFCSKMYMEAKYLDVLSIPIIHRGLFAELVGFCGHLGYANFFRRDWLETMLSWQSSSDIGCFVKDPKFPDDILTNDMSFTRQATKWEEENDVEPSEICSPHLTVVNLIALSTFYDYIMDNLDEKIIVIS